MDSIVDAFTTKEIKTALAKLPKSLSTTCEAILAGIEARGDSSYGWAERVLWWVSFAESLTVFELQHALATEPEATSLDEEINLELQREN
jgi:hypothetical protein